MFNLSDDKLIKANSLGFKLTVDEPFIWLHTEECSDSVLVSNLDIAHLTIALKLFKFNFMSELKEKGKINIHEFAKSKGYTYVSSSSTNRSIKLEDTVLEYVDDKHVKFIEYSDGVITLNIDKLCELLNLFSFDDLNLCKQVHIGMQLLYLGDIDGILIPDNALFEVTDIVKTSYGEFMYIIKANLNELGVTSMFNYVISCKDLESSFKCFDKDESLLGIKRFECIPNLEKDLNCVFGHLLSERG